ncbi:UNVERIFIED_ORG: hypothetical protein J2Y81_007945 [Paraburkholderia sediminicola]|nr:hypothetical protein [Paraburkholderia sediminicola]
MHDDSLVFLGRADNVEVIHKFRAGAVVENDEYCDVDRMQPANPALDLTTKMQA